MKNQKLNLDELKVQSFVTDFDKEQEQTKEINGGDSGIFCLYIPVVDPYKPIDIWSLACSYGCGFNDISEVINPVDTPVDIPVDVIYNL